MIEIQSNKIGRISLHGKKMIVFPAGCRTTTFINDDYDVLLIVAGIDRTMDITLNREATIIVEAGIRTEINTHGPAAHQSTAIFIAGIDNKVNGVPNQDKGRIVGGGDRDFDIGAISSFEKIEIL